MAQLAITLAGNALSSSAKGEAFGWKSFGLMTGMGLFSHFFGKREFVGERLADLSVQKSIEGAAIATIYGEGSVAGNVIWSTGKTEHIEDVDSGGKLGPPPAQTATYTSNFAILLSEQLDGNRIERPLKIWFNQHLKYDYNAGDQQGFTFSYDPENDCWTGTKNTCTLRFYGGAQTQPDPLIEADKGVGLTPAFVDRCYLVVENLPLAEFGNDVPNVRVLSTSEVKDAAGIFRSLCRAAGLLDSDIDPGFLEEVGQDIEFRGFMRSEVAPGRGYLDNLGLVMFCHFPIVDGRVTARKRAGNPLFEIDERDCRWNYAGQKSEVSLFRTNDRELLERVELSFIDPRRRYSSSMRRGRRIETSSRRKASFAVPVVMNGNFAQALADSLTWQSVVESRSWSLMLPWDYLYLAAGDIFTLKRTGEGGNVARQRVRIEEMSKGLPGPIAVKAVAHDDKITQIILTEDVSGYPDDAATTVAPPFGFISDTVVLSQSSPDLSAGDYVLVGVTGRKIFKWTGARVLLARRGAGQEDEEDWNRISDTVQSTPATIGTLRFDYTPVFSQDYESGQSLSVNMVRGSLNSAASLDMLERGANTLIFENGVVVSFLSAQGDGVDGDGGNRYDLSTLKAGRFTSDDLIEGVIPAGSRFLLLRDSEAQTLGGYAFLKMSPAYRGQEVRVAVLGLDDEVSNRVIHLLPELYRARTLEEPSPRIQTLGRDATTGELIVKGTPRTRFIDAALSENGIAPSPSAPQFAGKYKYQVKMVSSGAVKTVDRYSEDENALFDFRFTSAELAALFGTAPTAGSIQVSVAIYGALGLGRASDPETDGAVVSFLSIAANDYSWTDTGITLIETDSIQIRATGLASYGASQIGPNGSSAAFVNGFSTGSLVGVVMSGPDVPSGAQAGSFFVGADATVTSKAGRLWLRFNDGADYSDNSGSFGVTLSR